MNKNAEKILNWLLDHPGWHYGLDLVKANVAGRSAVYTELGRLEEDGYVETREVAPEFPGALPRVQHRATGKRIPVDGDLSPQFT